MGRRVDRVKLLLDTHTFIWAVSAPARLSSDAARLLAAADNELFLSSATAWELATKYRIGKLPAAEALLDSFAQLAEDLRAQPLPITHDHALKAGLLSSTHRDPFDRMLAAQAELEDLYLVTRDPAFATFDVKVLW